MKQIFNQWLQELVPIAIGMYGSLSQKAFRGELTINKTVNV